MNILNEAYLNEKIAKAQSAIAFASPNADLSFARATLVFAQQKLEKMRLSA